MTCPDWLILSTPDPERIVMLFSLFGILLLLNLLVFWRSRVSPIINLLVLTGLMLVDFVWLHQLSRRVLQGWLTTHSQLEIFLTVGKPLKLILCSKKVMQATHLIIVQFLSLQSYLYFEDYWTLRPRFFVRLSSSEQLDLDSPVFVSIMVFRLLWLKKLMNSY